MRSSTSFLTGSSRQARFGANSTLDLVCVDEAGGADADSLDLVPGQQLADHAGDDLDGAVRARRRGDPASASRRSARRSSTTPAATFVPPTSTPIVSPIALPVWPLRTPPPRRHRLMLWPCSTGPPRRPEAPGWPGPAVTSRSAACRVLPARTGSRTSRTSSGRPVPGSVPAAGLVTPGIRWSGVPAGPAGSSSPVSRTGSPAPGRTGSAPSGEQRVKSTDRILDGRGHRVPAPDSWPPRPGPESRIRRAARQIGHHWHSGDSPTSGGISVSRGVPDVRLLGTAAAEGAAHLSGELPAHVLRTLADQPALKLAEHVSPGAPCRGRTVAAAGRLPNLGRSEPDRSEPGADPRPSCARRALPVRPVTRPGCSFITVTISRSCPVFRPVICPPPRHLSAAAPPAGPAAAGSSVAAGALPGLGPRLQALSAVSMIVFSARRLSIPIIGTRSRRPAHS